MSDFDHPAFGPMPDRIYADRDEETNEKRWYSTRGMGEPYIRVANHDKLVEVENLHAEITKLKSQLEEARAKAIEECADDVEMETSIAPKAWERSDDYAAGWLDCRERAVAVIRALLSAPTEERGRG